MTTPTSPLLGAWWNRTAEALIAWGTRTEWHRPTVLEVVAEEILPHVILVLFIVLFVHICYLASIPADDDDDDADADDDDRAHADKAASNDGDDAREGHHGASEATHGSLRMVKTSS